MTKDSFYKKTNQIRKHKTYNKIVMRHKHINQNHNNKEN